MSVSEAEIQRVAELAALSLEPQDVKQLTSQLQEILEFVAQLDDVKRGGDGDGFRPGPSLAPLREDIVAPIEMSHPIDTFAPQTRDGFFLVPKVASLGEEDD